MTEKFEGLLNQWRIYENQAQEIYEKQGDLTEAISVAFADVVRERQLLAPLKWDFSAAGRLVEISCHSKKDDAIRGLLDKFNKSKYDGSVC